VYVVDDDASFRKSLLRLLRAHGLEAQSYDSAASFLKSGLTNRDGCILLDIRMPGLSGLDLQAALAKAACTMPVIFLTGHGDIPTSVWAMKKGATDFLTKPVDEDNLLSQSTAHWRKMKCATKRRGKSKPFAPVSSR
jgi:FixJ family two-component response regulator